MLLSCPHVSQQFRTLWLSAYWLWLACMISSPSLDVKNWHAEDPPESSSDRSNISGPSEPPSCAGAIIVLGLRVVVIDSVQPDHGMICHAMFTRHQDIVAQRLGAFCRFLLLNEKDMVQFPEDAQAEWMLWNTNYKISMELDSAQLSLFCGVLLQLSWVCVWCSTVNPSALSYTCVYTVTVLSVLCDKCREYVLTDRGRIDTTH